MHKILLIVFMAIAPLLAAPRAFAQEGADRTWTPGFYALGARAASVGMMHPKFEQSSSGAIGGGISLLSRYVGSRAFAEASITGFLGTDAVAGYAAQGVLGVGWQKAEIGITAGVKKYAYGGSRYGREARVNASEAGITLGWRFVPRTAWDDQTSSDFGPIKLKASPPLAVVGLKLTASPAARVSTQIGSQRAFTAAAEVSISVSHKLTRE